MTHANLDAGAQAPLARIAHYPVTFFAIGMGLMGLTLAARATEHAFALPAVASPWVLWVSCGLLFAVSVGYAAKALLHPAQVRDEGNHPVRIAFFPAMSISLPMPAAALLKALPQMAHAIWLVGTVAQGVPPDHGCRPFCAASGGRRRTDPAHGDCHPRRHDLRPRMNPDTKPAIATRRRPA